jgi:4-amino-4-deoxy-L-arabinose transferase-like glycosyltransferase
MSARHARPLHAPRPPVWLVPVAVLVTGVTLAIHLVITVTGTGRALVTFDSAEYAIAGRATARDGRLVTTFVLPHETRAPATPPFPLVLGHPLVPLADAAVFRLAGEHAWLTLLPAALALLVLAACVAGLAPALGAGPGLTLVAVVTLALHPQILHYASEGLTEIPFAAALAAAALAIVRPVTRGRAVAFGLALGIAHLARPVMGPLLPAWLIALACVAPRGMRLRAVGWALVAFAPFALGITLHKWLATGDPTADVARYNLLIGLDPRFTPLSVQCAVDPPAPFEWLRAHPHALPAKLARELPGLALAAWTQAGWLAPLALVGAVSALLHDERRGVAVALIGSSLLLALLIAATLPSHRYLIPLLPLQIAFAFVTLERLMRRLGLAGPVAMVAALALAVPVALRPTAHDWRLAVTRRVPDRGTFDEREWREAGLAIARRVPPGTLIASDAGAFVAWYADRPAVLIPERPGDLAVLGRRLPVDALVLTNEWLLDQPGFESWNRLVTGTEDLEGWRRADSVVSGRLHAALWLRER